MASGTNSPAAPFQGIPLEAVDFYRELELNNTREWWLANKKRYDTLVREPFLALAEEVAPAFGEPKVYRPNRDVRFSNDKSPYKTHQGLFVRSSSHTGWYFQLDAEGIFLGGGAWWLASDQITRFRSAISNDPTGVLIEGITRELTDARYEIGGEQLATRPRGVSADAPRLDLLRRKALTCRLPLGQPEWMATSDLAEYLRDGWHEVRPLVEWLDDYVGESERPRR